MAPFANDPFRGARQRPVLAEGQRASDLEIQAARHALDDAGMAGKDIDLLLVTSHMADNFLPSNAPIIQHALGLERAAVITIDTACASFITQVHTVAAYFSSQMARTALCVASGTLASRFLDISSPACVHFGDGAAAAVLAQRNRDAGLLSWWSRTDGSIYKGVVLSHVSRDSGAAEVMEDVRGPLQITTLDPQAGKIGGLKAAHWCKEACHAVLEDADLQLSDVGIYVGAQSLKWFPEACRLALGLPVEKVIESFDTVANISAASIPYNLWLARNKGLLAPGAIVLMYSPGAGLTRSAALLKW